MDNIPLYIIWGYIRLTYKRKNQSSSFPGVVYNKLSKEDLNKNIKLAKKGDEKAFEKILAHMYSYLDYLSKEFFIQGSDGDDVYQEAAIKLLNVIEKFDNTKGGFVTFAQSSIRKHIITVMNRFKSDRWDC